MRTSDLILHLQKFYRDPLMLCDDTINVNMSYAFTTCSNTHIEKINSWVNFKLETCRTSIQFDTIKMWTLCFHA